MDPIPAARTPFPRLRLLAAVLLAALAVVLGLVLSVPLWIDAPGVRARIVALVDDLSSGRARWEALELHYFPRPSASLRQVSFALPPRVAFEARTVTVELEFLPLLRGEVRAHRVLLASPRVRVQLPPPDPAAPPLTAAHVRTAVRGVLDALFERAPAATLELGDGELDLLTATGTSLRFTAIALQGRVTAGRLEASASASSPLFDGLVVDAALRREGLEGTGRAKLGGLHLGALAALLPGTAITLGPADADAELAWRMKGLEDLSANLGITAPALAANRGAGRLEMTGLAVEARASLVGEAFDAELSRAAVSRPLLEARGRLSYAPGTGWRAALEAPRIDLGQAQASATRLLQEASMLAKPPVQVAEGSIAALTLETAGPALGDLGALPALRAEARLEGAALRIPAASLDVRDVGAHATLAGGTLRVDRLAARTVAGDVTAGTLAAKLDARPVTLEGEVSARLDFAGAAALARRVLDPSGSAYRELQRVHDLQGSTRVRVNLAGDTHRPRLRVELSALRASARHDLLPLPIAVSGGSATLEGSHLSLQGLSGSAGRSTLRDAAARLQLGTAASLESASGSAEIDLAEVLRVARARPEIAEKLEGVRSATGQLAVHLESAAGPLADPRALVYSVSASPRDVKLDLPALGPSIALDGGQVTVTPRDVEARAVGVALLDGVLRVGGRVPIVRRRGAVPQVSASGTLGPEILDWAQARAALPKAARLRDPVTLEDVALDWFGGGSFATRGGVSIAGGPALAFDVRRAAPRIEVRSLTVRDAHSDCSVEGSLEGSRFAWHFAGHLSGRSLAGPMRRPDLAGALIQGDLSASGDWTDAGFGKADGHLEASQVPVPTGVAGTLLIERAQVDADGTRIRIPEAVALLGPSRLTLEGSIDRAARKFRVDAKLRGDTLELPPSQGTAPAVKAAPQAEPREPAAKAAKAKPGKPAARDAAAAWDKLFTLLEQVPLTGRVQVDLGRFRSGRLEIAPLQAAAMLEAGRLQLDIGKAALCAIALSGSFSVQRGSLGAAGTLSASGAPLETTVPCLTNGRLRFTGRLDLDGTFSAQGAPGALADSFKAKFSAISHDGRIDKFDALSRLLRMINLTEVARGAIKDLGAAGMAYRTASVAGHVDRGVVTLDEAILDAEGVKIVAEGTIDYGDGALAANVLVAPMQTANWLVDKIPLVRRIFGGTVLAIPARVGGTVKDPVVVPLGPLAVGSRMMDMLANTVRLPVDLVKSLETTGDKAAKPVEPPGNTKTKP